MEPNFEHKCENCTVRLGLHKGDWKVARCDNGKSFRPVGGTLSMNDGSTYEWPGYAPTLTVADAKKFLESNGHAVLPAKAFEELCRPRMTSVFGLLSEGHEAGQKLNITSFLDRSKEVLVLGNAISAQAQTIDKNLAALGGELHRAAEAVIKHIESRVESRE